MKKNIIRVVFITAIIIVGQAPAYADIWRVNDELTIQFNKDMVLIERNVNRRENLSNSDLRGRDLMRAIKDFIAQIKYSASALKARQSDQVRGIELNRISASNTKDMIQRNKTAQESQKRLQEDRLQALRAQNRDLAQRTRDLSLR